VGLYALPWHVERGRKKTSARYNIAPTQQVLMVHNGADGKQVVLVKSPGRMPTYMSGIR